MALTDKLIAIASAIRGKTGKTEEMTLEQMAIEINGISAGDDINNQDKTITENGTYSADAGYTGLGMVVVKVSQESQSDMVNQWKTAIEKFSGQVTAIPEGLYRIGDYAFYNNAFLAITSLPESIVSIGYNAFWCCTALAIKSIPAKVGQIKSCAFQKCYALTEITFEGTPTTIANDAFQDCTNLLTINVPWAEGAVANAPWGATNAVIQYNYTEE